LAPSKNTLEVISIDSFKETGYTLRMALLKPMILIEHENDLEAMLFTNHDDPIQGHVRIVTRSVKECLRKCDK